MSGASVWLCCWRLAESTAPPQVVPGQVRTDQDRTDLGATMIEYALVLSVLAGAALAVLPALGSQGAAAVHRQAVCISSRPAPLACHDSPNPAMP
jgi:hypothetical protein